jgi:serine phosphatase RsbU (regulator of sigma subunit)
VVKEICAGISEFTGNAELHDDVTVIALRRCS